MATLLSLQSEEALEVFVVPENVRVIPSEEEEDRNYFVLSNIPGHSEIVLYAESETVRDAWVYVIENTV